MVNLFNMLRVKKCIQLENELCPTNKHVLIDNAVNDLNCRLNILLADFAHCSSSTLLVLFKTYCMTIYGSQNWSYSKNCKFYISRKKAIRRLWKYRIELITNLFTLLIIVCLLTWYILAKYSWNTINSNCKLYHNIVNLSLNNVSTSIGENVRYFMYKYMIQEYDWYESINIIYKKIDSYLLSHFNEKVQCDAAVIR